MDRVKRIWYLSPIRAAKVQASLRIRAVSPEPSLLAHTNSESRGNFRQKTRSLAPLNGWTCAVEICHDGMLEETNSLDGAHICKLKKSDITLIPIYLLPSTGFTVSGTDHQQYNINVTFLTHALLCIIQYNTRKSIVCYYRLLSTIKFP